MQTVVTLEQAKQITRGRTPLVPVQYEQAVLSLQQCIDIDEAKIWGDKADALAAWAKIYRDDTVSRKAKVLKLLAYRRMGELAMELRPHKPKGRGIPGGPIPLLQDAGLRPDQARAAVVIGSARQAKFDRIVANERVPTPLYLAQTMCRTGSSSWVEISRAMMSFRSWCRSHEARSVARGLLSDEVDKSREIVTELTEWLDAFEQALPK